MDFLSNGVGLVSTILVAFALVLVFVAGISTIVKKVRAVQQYESKNYITGDQAAQIKEQNESIITQLKAINAKAGK